VSKKKFADDLGSLFGFTPEVEVFQEDNPLLKAKEEKKVSAKRKPSTKKDTTSKARKKISKNFNADLESLFSEVFEEKVAKISEKQPERAKRIRKVRPRLGLDSLIRNTRDTDTTEGEVTKEQKRVTFLYSKKQLEKLKQISKKDSRFMKDIIGEALTAWLDEYPLEDVSAN